jgi:hypothetical protein
LEVPEEFSFLFNKWTGLEEWRRRGLYGARRGRSRNGWKHITWRDRLKFGRVLQALWNWNDFKPFIKTLVPAEDSSAIVLETASGLQGWKPLV